MLRFIRYSFLIVVIFFFCSWGFHAHRTINRSAVYVLPSEMNVFFLDHIKEIEERSVLADKRRYTDTTEACKHYIDMDLYGSNPFDAVPDYWFTAKEKYSEDTLISRGILPWAIYWEYKKLVSAMDSGYVEDVIKHAADLGHYVADACVPLHTTFNYNGQHTNQHGIHSLWESRIPESFSSDYGYYVGKSVYLPDPLGFSWVLIKESFALVDSTLALERKLSEDYNKDGKYRFESKNGKIGHQYAYAFVSDYHSLLDGMVERRMQRAIFAIGSFWYSAWVDAGKPELNDLKSVEEFNKLNKTGDSSPKRIHE